MGVVRSETVDVQADGSRHRLDTAGHDHVLVARQYGHSGERDGLLTRTAEPVQRHARCIERPTGVERGHAGDVHRVIAGTGAGTHDHVVDISGVKANAVA